MQPHNLRRTVENRPPWLLAPLVLLGELTTACSPEAPIRISERSASGPFAETLRQCVPRQAEPASWAWSFGGTVGTGAPASAFYIPIAGVAAYLDADAVLDIALFSSTSNSPDAAGAPALTILDGSKQFRVARGPWPQPFNDLGSADFDGSGVFDLGSAPAFTLLNAAGDAGDRIDLMRVNGPALWTDVDGDAKIDLVSAPLQEDLQVRLGTAWPHFTDPVTSPNLLLSEVTASSAEHLTLADASGDGVGDLMAFRVELTPEGVRTTSLVVLTGDGAGRFENRDATAFSPSSALLDAAVGDFDCDGKADWVMALEEAESSLAVLLRTDTGWEEPLSLPTLTLSEDVGNAGRKVRVGDFNGDGAHDLVTAFVKNTGVNRYSDLEVLLGRGDGTFAEPVQLDTDTPWGLVGVADLNSDGLDDIYAGGGGADGREETLHPSPVLGYWLSAP